MEIKRLSFALEEMKADADALTFSGYASTFGNVDNQKDVVMPGAFERSIKERGNDIYLLWQHDMHEPIGKPTVLREEKRGLYVEGAISRTDTGIKAHTLLKDGVITRMSIGYSPKKYSIDQKKGIRILEDVDLWEISLVTFPANSKAVVTGVKSLDGIAFEQLHERKSEIEAALRDAGASQSVAKYVASLVPPPALCDAGGKELLHTINNAINILRG